MQSWWSRLLPGFLQRRIRDSPTLRKILGNTSWLMFERIVNMTVRFLVGVWVIRYLGPEKYGVYSYALSFVGLFTVVTTLGLDGIVVRNLSSKKWSEGKVMGTAFALRMVAGVLTIGVVAATIFSVSDEWITQIAVLVVSVELVFKSADVFKLWFKSEIKSKYPVWVRSGVTVLYAGSQIACILAGFSVLAFVILVVVQTGLKVIGTYLMYRHVPEKGNPPWKFEWTTARQMMRDAWPLIFAGLSVAVYMKIDQVMIGEMVGESAVGIYATAVKVSELWYFIPTAIAGSVFPKIVTSKENASEEVYQKRMQAFYDILALLSYVIVIPMTLVAEPLVGLVFGAEYSESGSILKVHIWAFLFVSLGAGRGKWLVTENFTRFSMITAVVGAIVNVGLNYILIPSYAGTGAAWATLISQVVAVFLSCLIWRRLHGVFVQMGKALFVPFRIRSVIRNNFGNELVTGSDSGDSLK
nr:flippase [Salinibacter sp. 10B]